MTKASLKKIAQTLVKAAEAIDGLDSVTFELLCEKDLLIPTGSELQEIADTLLEIK